MIVPPSLSKSFVFKKFSVHIKTRSHPTPTPRFEEHFRKAPFSFGVSVDGRPNRRTKAAFSNYFTKQGCYSQENITAILSSLPNIYKQQRRGHKNQLHATLRLPLCRYIRNLCSCHLSKLNENTSFATYRKIILDMNGISLMYLRLFKPFQPIFLLEIIINRTRRVSCLYLTVQFNSLSPLLLNNAYCRTCM